MRIFTIKEVKGVVKCDEGGKAEHVFNVKNASDKSLKAGIKLSISEPVKEEWLQIDGPTEHILNVDQMTQITVKIQVPPGCKPGQYSYRLRVFDPDQPGEIFTEGESVFFEVPPEKEDIVIPDGGETKKKWWIPAAIVAALVVIGLIVWQVLPKKLEMPDFTQQEWTQAAAEKFLEDNHLKFSVELHPDPDPMAQRQILAQVPPPGTKLEKDEKIILKIAAIPVPPLENLSLSAALQTIGSKGLSFDTETDLKIQRVTVADQHEKVLNQDPEKGKLVAKKSSVKLTVGRLANRRFDIHIKDISKLKTMEGIKMSPNFITREVQPLSE